MNLYLRQIASYCLQYRFLTLPNRANCEQLLLYLLWLTRRVVLAVSALRASAFTHRPT